MLLSVTPSADATNPLILCILIALFVVFVASHILIVVVLVVICHRLRKMNLGV